MILVDERGRPIAPPAREDYTTAWEYVRAYHAYRDAVARVANEGFDTAWRCLQVLK